MSTQTDGGGHGQRGGGTGRSRGAARQRAVFARTGRLEDVVADVARQTRG
ncbi:hypothetical protein ABZ807_06505 [Micromonospora sp. NPDC047548]